MSAVIVTRGNTDLTPVLESLAAFDEVIVWDNSKQHNRKTYGRILGACRARNDVIYSQDDDIIHSPHNHQWILDAYQPGMLTGCMWQEWSDGARAQGIPNGYDDLVFPGSGSVWDINTPGNAIEAYLAEWPEDEFFDLWCDTIVGIIAPTQQLDIRFDALPEAEDDYRMCNMPNAVELKTEAIRRARAVRDRKRPGHEVRVDAAISRAARAAGVTA